MSLMLDVALLSLDVAYALATRAPFAYFTFVDILHFFSQAGNSVAAQWQRRVLANDATALMP